MSMPMSHARRRERQKKLSEAAMSAIVDDEDATRKSVMAVVQLWLDRLQLVSVITTFFASTDGLLLSFTTSLVHLTAIDVSQWSKTVQVMHASLAGALIFHTCAAIIAFVGSFVLVRYKLLDARQRMDNNGTETPMTMVQPIDGEAHTHIPRTSSRQQMETAGITDIFDLFQNFSDIFNDMQGRVGVHRVRLFRPQHPNNGLSLEPPVKLLANCHTVAVTMAVCGFVLALLGIEAFVWTALPLGVGIFASVCLGVCLFASVAAFLLS